MVRRALPSIPLVITLTRLAILTPAGVVVVAGAIGKYRRAVVGGWS